MTAKSTSAKSAPKAATTSGSIPGASIGESAGSDGWTVGHAGLAPLLSGGLAGPSILTTPHDRGLPINSDDPEDDWPALDVVLDACWTQLAMLDEAYSSVRHTLGVQASLGIGLLALLAVVDAGNLGPVAAGLAGIAMIPSLGGLAARDWTLLEPAQLEYARFDSAATKKLLIERLSEADAKNRKTVADLVKLSGWAFAFLLAAAATLALGAYLK